MKSDPSFVEMDEQYRQSVQPVVELIVDELKRTAARLEAEWLNDDDGLSAETRLHVRLVEQAGCGHPPYYDFGEGIVEGYCKLCRREHVVHDPAWARGLE